MFNPFFIYAYSFIAAFILYALKFSNIYPQLTWQTIVFFLITCVISIGMGINVLKEDKMKYNSLPYHRSLIYITLLLLASHVAEFIYTGMLPILGIGNYIEYTGIPTFHVIVYTFNIFFSIYLFQVILSNLNKKSVYILFILTLIPPVLIMARGMLVNIVIGCLFLFLYKIGNNVNFYIKHTWKLILLGIIGLYLFGVSGNVRNNTINQFENKFESLYIMEVGAASESFRNSIIPKEFFWGYLYISSPLANFQKVVETHEPEINMDNIKRYFANEVVMDFISKRVFKSEFNEEKNFELITDSLNVGTGFRGAYYYLGWLGVSIQFIILMGVSYIYMKILSPNNPLRIVGVAMLANLIALFTFSNMITYSGMSFQLAYPIIWEIYLRTKDPILNRVKLFYENKEENSFKDLVE